MNENKKIKHLTLFDLSLTLFNIYFLEYNEKFFLVSITRLRYLFILKVGHFSVLTPKENQFKATKYVLKIFRGGGFLILTWFTYMCLPFGALFRKNWYSNRGGVSSETKELKLHKLGVFWASYCKKHPIWSKLGAVLSEMVYWWVGNWAKNWYRESQIFEVRQAHPWTILVKITPLGKIC